MLDCVDGELARLKGASSREGVYLDVVGHYIADAFMIGGFSLGVYNAVKQPWVPYVGFLFVVAYLVSDLLAQVSREQLDIRGVKRAYG
ncbi:CDP-alcohol phosphatidyltransferase family protein [Symbiobacterium thermophilum]|uniref:CDP-alcohol phosphatidyltransferase family protein n=1 Tax=Symbiobacterium thermophilum TaxID=2734 RepID=UPI003B84536A